MLRRLSLVTTATTVWVYLAAAGALAAWVMVRFRNVRPRTLISAFALFVAGQLVPLLGLLVLPAVLQAGMQPALLIVILPSFFIPWLTLGWLLRAIVESIRAPRRMGRTL